MKRPREEGEAMYGPCIDPVNYFPSEVLARLFYYIPMEYLPMLCCVSKTWRYVLSQMWLRECDSITRKNDYKRMAKTKKRKFCERMAAMGETTLVEWGKNHGCEFDYLSAAKAARHGHIGTLKWITKNLKHPPWDEQLLISAAKGGRIDVFMWIIKNGYPWEGYDDWDKLSSHPTTNAAKKGHFELLKRMIHCHCLYKNEKCMYYAAKYGNEDMLAWLKHIHTWSSDACAGAASGGQLKTLKWLRSKSCPWDSRTTKNAAKKGNLEMLKWAVDNGCDWTEDVSHIAAINGRLDMLKWATEKGCQWSFFTVYEARERKQFETMQWAIDHGAPNPTDKEVKKEYERARFYI